MIDLAHRTSPSPSYRWGVAQPGGVSSSGRYVIEFWFKTRKAAESWGDNTPGPYAVARWA